MEECHSVLPPSSIHSTFPVIYRQRIYFLSSVTAQTQFIANPEYYLGQDVPRLPVPVRLAIVGPPKSGKTTSVYLNNVIELTYICIFKYHLIVGIGDL